ncbi:hypothetical protein SELMODRAFT_82262 [Selaginella moellendorffii]|uniref:COX assembly mitochondrial protein n=2 Tax=Selaginella moellendorffii TaxID=88036 RepID=D8QYZ8_SELML|nr:hypothetical protein SELMODRAFT_88660 [Selaginella moellendorffii]EFJ34332.1 hypothetical protein SELMODRAFT_82262 [Selaginella moellendorffii]
MKRRERVQKKVEEELRSKMKAQAFRKCDPVVAKYAECAKGRTFSMAWACRAQAKEMNECLHLYTTDAVLEEYKQDYLKQHTLR